MRKKNRLENAPPAGTSLPFDDLIDILLGRVLRDGVEEPAVLSTDISNAYALGNPDWKYSISHIDDETNAPPGNLLDAMNAVSTPSFAWDGWDRAKSISMVKALRASDLHRIGRVLVGLPQIALINFPVEVPLVARQELHSSIGITVDDDIAVTVTEIELG